MWKKWWKKEILLQVPVASRYFKTLINHSPNQSISWLRPIICKTWAYQNSNKAFERHWHVHTLINHSPLRLGHIKTRSIICKTLGISRLTDQSFARLRHMKTPINYRKSLAYPYSNYLRKTWAYQLRHHQSFTRLGYVTGYWLVI